MGPVQNVEVLEVIKVNNTIQENTIMDKRYIEVEMSNVSLDYEKEMLSGVRIPSLLPMNILKMDDRSIMCFNTSGFKTLAEVEIINIETMCQIIKSYIKAIYLSEQYLLKGGKHFLSREMVFIDIEKKEVKLIYGNGSKDNVGFADNNVIVNFLNELKSGIMDSVLGQIIDEISSTLVSKNPRPERLVPIVEDVERKWYRRNN